MINFLNEEPPVSKHPYKIATTNDTKNFPQSTVDLTFLFQPFF